MAEAKEPKALTQNDAEKIQALFSPRLRASGFRLLLVARWLGLSHGVVAAMRCSFSIGTT